MNSDSIGSRIRSLAISTLTKYERVSSSARAILREQAENIGLSGEDSAVLNMLVLGVIKRLNTIDFILARVLTNRSPASLSFTARAALRLAIFEGRWLEVPFTTLKAHYTELGTVLLKTLQHGLKIDLTDAIKGFERAGQLSILLSHPTFMVETLLENLPENEAIELMEANNKAPDHYVRLNRLLVSNDEQDEILNDIGTNIVLDPDFSNLYYVPEGIDMVVRSQYFESGRVLIHDKGSVATVHALSPQRIDTIWDACAAPGMKTQLIAENIGPRGKLVASDFYPTRVHTGVKRCRKMGCHFSQWLLADAAYPPVRGIDKILIDAPCTSTGILQRDPSYKWRLNKEYLTAMMTVQNKILDSILNTFKDSPGVEVLYATCSLLPHEGESQIDSVLSSHDVELMDLDLNYSEGYSGFDCSGKVQRLFPHTDRTNAFFIAKLKIPP